MSVCPSISPMCLLHHTSACHHVYRYRCFINALLQLGCTLEAVTFYFTLLTKLRMNIMNLARKENYEIIKKLSNSLFFSSLYLIIQPISNIFNILWRNNGYLEGFALVFYTSSQECKPFNIRQPLEEIVGIQNLSFFR